MCGARLKKQGGILADFYSGGCMLTVISSIRGLVHDSSQTKATITAMNGDISENRLGWSFSTRLDIDDINSLTISSIEPVNFAFQQLTHEMKRRAPCVTTRSSTLSRTQDRANRLIPPRHYRIRTSK